MLLEVNLIKQLKPRYNVLLRDDKTYPYLKLTVQEEWPRLAFTRRIGSDGAAYFGPYLPEESAKDITLGGGLTQFADPNGTAEVTSLSQNGYAAGEFVSVGVNDNGRVVVSYNNGQQLEVAQVVTANFNAVNQLKRMDGGVFAATAESGEPILDNDGGIIGSSLEASNTDISATAFRSGRPSCVLIAPHGSTRRRKVGRLHRARDVECDHDIDAPSLDRRLSRTPLWPRNGDRSAIIRVPPAASSSCRSAPVLVALPRLATKLKPH